MVLSIILMTVDHRQQHLDALRSTLSVVVYPLQALVNMPNSLSGWFRESLSTRRQLQEENASLRTQQLVLQTRLQKLEALEAENRLAESRIALSRAEQELLITNAYIIPEQPSIDFVRELTARGVRVRILTNSLESHDVPAVNSHYGPYRKRLLEAGIDLYELRHDAAVKSEVDAAPVVSGFVGLHTKASAVDRSRAFIGSFNLDPRSRNINTEMGILIDSPELAEELAQKIENLMQPENSWRVQLNENGKVIWVSGDIILTRQPAQSGWQRFLDLFFKLFPKEYY